MIVAVVIVFVSVGAYFFKDKESKNKSEISVEVTNVSNEQLTDNWKTFINSHDGYSFKYPEKMGSPVINGYSELSSFGFKISSDFAGMAPNFATIYIFNGSIDKAIASYKKIDSNGRIYKGTEDIIIGGKKGRILNWTFSSDNSKLIRSSYFVEYQTGKTLMIYGSKEFLTTIKFLWM